MVSKPVPQPHQESDKPRHSSTKREGGGGQTRVYRNDKSETGCSSQLEQCL